MQPTFQDLQERYAAMSTEELLRIAVTAELTAEATTAMQAELQKRRKELASKAYEIHVGSIARLLPRFLWRWSMIAIVVLLAIVRLLLPFG